MLIFEAPVAQSGQATASLARVGILTSDARAASSPFEDPGRESRSREVLVTDAGEVHEEFVVVPV